MNNALNIELNYQEEFTVRMVGTQERPEWVAADVCSVLDITKTGATFADFPDDEKGSCIVTTPGGRQEMLTVMEPGLYRLITRSRKPEAERFQRWMFHDVLPSIRRHGCYPPPAAMTWAGPDHAIVQRNNETVTALVVAALNPRFDKLEVGQVEIAGRLDRVENQVCEVRKDLKDYTTSRRQDFPEQVKLAVRKATVQNYLGNCPFCLEVLVVDTSTYEHTAEAEYDHFAGRQDNTFENAWILCANCHEKKTHRKRFNIPKHEFEIAFNEFQRRAERKGFVGPVKKESKSSLIQQKKLF